MNKALAIFLVLAHCVSGQISETENWFEFIPNNNLSESVISLKNWIDKPAGKHGFVQNVNDKIISEDGTELKFWGVNICSALPYSDKEKVDNWIETMSVYGINSVRFHKFTKHGMNKFHSTDLTPGKYKKLDYFHSKLKSAGIYYGWSPIYGHKPLPGDKSKLMAYEEIANAALNSHLSNSTIGLVNFADDIQDLHIELLVNMLNHYNPFTGLKYAEDPALAFIEFQNEDNIFFATCERMIELCPAYKSLLNEKFTTWLNQKYSSSEKFYEAWGEEAIEWGIEVKGIKWDINKANITPVVNHGIYDYEFKKYQGKDESMPVFLLDMARFLYEEQVEYYRKVEKRIRDTGYRGMLVGSCWQAGSGISHYYNLSADYLVGMIDRHNYFGGGTGHRLEPGKFNSASMLSKPGSGLLSLGMQQVSDRPFSISEWLSLIPNEWIAEGTLIVAAYGLGLQGWDASFSFASDSPFFTNTMHTPNVYNVMSPLQLSLYPAISRMVYRNDIAEGKIISERNVSIPDLEIDGLRFYEDLKQDYDVKDYLGVVPREALAAGKVVVNFFGDHESAYWNDLSKYHDPIKKIINSSTGELCWYYSGSGYFTINTENTQAAIGFAGGKKIDLDDIIIEVENKFAVVLITSLEADKSISNADRLLLTTIARARNSGMKFNADNSELLSVGAAPILIEPVSLKLTFKKRTNLRVNVLDHTGAKTNNDFYVESSEIHLDGNLSAAFYYELVFN